MSLCEPLAIESPFTVIEAVDTAAVAVTRVDPIDDVTLVAYDVVLEAKVGVRVLAEIERPDRLLFDDPARVTVTV